MPSLEELSNREKYGVGSIEYCELIRKCWNSDADKRLNFDEILDELLLIENKVNPNLNSVTSSFAQDSGNQSSQSSSKNSASKLSFVK